MMMRSSLQPSDAYPSRFLGKQTSQSAAVQALPPAAAASTRVSGAGEIARLK